jgi:desulfoferrodoxin (superoxide reductase-like protein)
MMEMPTISMFYGIIVSMFYEANERHHAPHIHVKYQGDLASIAIATGEVLSGSFPKKQLKLVQAWVEIHQDDLMADWELASVNRELFRITPLQ